MGVALGNPLGQLDHLVLGVLGQLLEATAAGALRLGTRRLDVQPDEVAEVGAVVAEIVPDPLGVPRRKRPRRRDPGVLAGGLCARQRCQSIEIDDFDLWVLAR